MITNRINFFSYMHKFIRIFIVLDVIFNRVHLYLSINGIKLLHESIESKQFREEHTKHSYSMLSNMYITK